MRKKRVAALSLIAAILIAAGGIIYYSIAQEEVKKANNLEVVTTFYPVYEFTKEVVGKEGEVSYLIRAGSEPHDFEPSSKNIADIEDADAFVYLNDNMETWVPDIEKNIAKSDTAIIEATGDMLLLAGNGIESDEKSHKGHSHELDPHVWLSPKRAITLVETIRDGLIKQFPKYKESFTKNAAAYIQKLRALDSSYTEALSSAKQNSFVTQHAAFAYLALDYELNQIPITGVSAETDPSAKRIASLSKYVSKYNIHYIYFEENASSSVAKTLADEVGVSTAVLNPIESLTDKQLSSGENYVTVMEENLKNLRLTTDVEGTAIEPETKETKTSENGYFDDKDVSNRDLTDWSGEWQSVYPYLLDGTLDQVFDYKALINKDKTAQEYKDYYTKGYTTDISKIKINGDEKKLTFTKDDGKSNTYTYEYAGYKILTYESGKKGVRYLFTAKEADAGQFKYIQFSDHQISKNKSEHFHIFFGGESHEALLKEMDNWPTYYPSHLTGHEIAQEMVIH
ncbi:zinc ABC transporter substrate-binding protein AdcA [Streptococcus dentiloxodontae]